MVEIKGKGSIIMKCRNGEEHVLKHVFFIPTLCNNIISLGKLSEFGNKVVMNGEYPWVHDHLGKLLVKVKKSVNRLYKIITESGEGKCLMTRTCEE